MDEIEVPTEHLHEVIHEKLEEEMNHHQTGWSVYVAISTALMAVLAAVSSLLAGHHSNESIVNQIKASDQWSYYQAKGIKSEIKKLELNYHQSTEADVERYGKEQEEIKKTAEKYKGKANAEARLVEHITTGEKAKFPDGHEEEHKIVKTSPPKDMEQVKNLVQWILSQ